jgi:hypothetical protein
MLLQSEKGLNLMVRRGDQTEFVSLSQTKMNLIKKEQMMQTAGIQVGA